MCQIMKKMHQKYSDLNPELPRCKCFSVWKCSRRTEKLDYTYKVRGSILIVNTSEKNLGDTLVDNYPSMNFNFSLQSSWQSYCPSQLHKLCSIELKESLQHAWSLIMTQPLLKYCVQYCCPQSQQNMNKAEEFQRRTMRITEKARKYLVEHSTLNFKEMWLDHSLQI